MAETDAVFGGEHSGHFYFREFWRADSGMLAALHALAALAEQDGPLSNLLENYTRFAGSGEINSTVEDQAAVLRRIEAAYAGEPEAEIDHLDGLTVTTPRWWFNVRASNTEPLLRLNAEAEDQRAMADLRDTVLAMIRSSA
jgi:phosphomannomutase